MKILYTTDASFSDNETIHYLNSLKNWKVTRSPTDKHTIYCCTRFFYDALVIDAGIPNFNLKKLICSIRTKQIFTPIIVIAKTSDDRLLGLKEGADMCLVRPFDKEEIALCIRTLKRRNSNYQSPNIYFEGISLNRPDGKICYNNDSLSVSPIEIDIFRLLTRASAPITIKALSEKIGEPKEKIEFFSNCLQTKINLLGAPISLIINNNKCNLSNEKEL